MAKNTQKPRSRKLSKKDSRSLAKLDDMLGRARKTGAPKKKAAPREDFSQAAARIVREATEGH